jgi:hypothetical protein
VEFVDPHDPDPVELVDQHEWVELVDPHEPVEFVDTQLPPPDGLVSKTRG